MWYIYFEYLLYNNNICKRKFYMEIKYFSSCSNLYTKHFSLVTNSSQKVVKVFFKSALPRRKQKHLLVMVSYVNT